MIKPQSILYSFHKDTHPQKPKYCIILYVDADLVIGLCLTTSQDRSGVKSERLKHGCIKDSTGVPISYVFLYPTDIGVAPDGSAWHFPLTTVVRFDYAFKTYTIDEFKAKTKDTELKCKMNDDEFGNFLYAFYHSEDIAPVLKPIIEDIMKELYS